MLGFLLIQPVTSSVGRGTKGKQQPRCQTLGRKRATRAVPRAIGAVGTASSCTRGMTGGEQIIFRHEMIQGMITTQS